MVKTSVLLACGVNRECYRELLGMQVATSEYVASWTGFFRDLKARGLGKVFLVTSDAHLGIQHAIGEVLPNASWQQCRTYFSKKPVVDGVEDAVADRGRPGVGNVPDNLPATGCRRGVGPGPRGH